MNKTELLSTYTAEQLAEMVVKQEEENQKLYDEANKWQKEAEQHRKVYQSICHLEDLESESVRLQSEVDKYRKAFEDAKKERDCQIAEYQKKIEELTAENAELYCELQAVNAFQEGYPTEPIKVADMLINAKGEYEHNPLVKSICGKDKGTYRIFVISELRQIAEHLLIYCNHNEGAEE